MPLNVVFKPDAVCRGLEAKKKKKMLRLLCGRAADVYGLDAETLFDEVWKRETLVATTVGYGVAIPHCRLRGLDRICVAMALWPDGVDFGSPDDEKTHIGILVAAPADKMEEDYLALLAFLGRVLRRDSNREFLLGADSAEIVRWFEENAT